MALRVSFSVELGLTQPTAYRSLKEGPRSTRVVLGKAAAKPKTSRPSFLSYHLAPPIQVLKPWKGTVVREG